MLTLNIFDKGDAFPTLKIIPGTSISGVGLVHTAEITKALSKSFIWVDDDISTTISPTPISPTPISPTTLNVISPSPTILSETDMLLTLLEHDVQPSEEKKTQDYVIESIKLTRDLFTTNIITALPFHLQAVMKEGKGTLYLPYSLASHQLSLPFPNLENLENFFEQATKHLVDKKIQSKTFKITQTESITTIAKFI